MTRSPADVVIIGAGVVGTAIARTLAAYSLDLVLVDAACDVGAGTSKANTAILHTGFDAKPGSLESRLLSRGSGLLRSYAAAARIPVERTGALLVAWTPDQVAAGVRLVLSAQVTAVAAASDGSWELATTRGPVRCRWVVNPAGLGSDELDRMFGGDGFTVRPRRGELIVFDKLARPLLRSILLPVPTARTKGCSSRPRSTGTWRPAGGPAGRPAAGQVPPGPAHPGTARAPRRGLAGPGGPGGRPGARHHRRPMTVGR